MCLILMMGEMKLYAQTRAIHLKWRRINESPLYMNNNITVPFWVLSLYRGCSVRSSKLLIIGLLLNILFTGVLLDCILVPGLMGEGDLSVCWVCFVFSRILFTAGLPLGTTLATGLLPGSTLVTCTMGAETRLVGLR